MSKQKINESDLKSVTGGNVEAEQLKGEIKKLQQSLGYVRDEKTILQTLQRIEELQNRLDQIESGRF